MPRLMPVPWMVLYEVVTAAGAEWRELSAADREKLTRLLLKSRGVPTNLTSRERADARRILAKVDVKRMAMQMVPKALGRRLRRR